MAVLRSSRIFAVWFHLHDVLDFCKNRKMWTIARIRFHWMGQFNTGDLWLAKIFYYVRQRIFINVDLSFFNRQTKEYNTPGMFSLIYYTRPCNAMRSICHCVKPNKSNFKNDFILLMVLHFLNLSCSLWFLYEVYWKFQKLRFALFIDAPLPMNMQ